MASRNSSKGSTDNQPKPQESQARRFRLLRYFTLTSLGILVPAALVLTYFLVQQGNFLLQHSQEDREYSKKAQEGLSKQQDAAARRDLLAIHQDGIENLAHLLKNALWERDFVTFVATAQEIPVEACRAMADVKDEKNGEMKPSSEKQACFSELGKKFMRIPGFANLNAKVYAAMKQSSVFRINIFDLRGMTIYSSENSHIGHDKDSYIGVALSKEGKPASELTYRDKFSALHGVVEKRDLIHIYLPLLHPDSDRIVGVFEVYSDVTPLLEQIKKTSADIKKLSTANLLMAEQANVAMQAKMKKWGNQALIIVLLLMLALFGALLMIVRRAAGLITRQENEEKKVGEKLRQSNNELRESEEMSRQLFESSRDALMILRPPSWRFTRANQATLELFGAASAAEFTELGPWSVSPEQQPDGRPSSERAQEAIAKAMDEGSNFFEWEHMRLNGERFSADVKLTRMGVGNDIFLQATIRDITERKRAEAEAALHASESRFRLMFERTADALLLLDPVAGQFIDCNQAATDMLRCTDKHELLLLHPAKLSPPYQPDGRPSGEKADEMIATALRNGSHRFEWIHCSAHRADFPVEVLLTPILIEEKQLLITTWRDITEKKKSEELIWQQANFDTLTGLPNRRMFHDRLEQEIKKSHRSGLPMALMLLDLDHFKEVNDTLGHPQGDVLLVEAARRIAECVRESDTVARLGGDEFIVILSEMEDTNSIERIAQKIVDRLAAPFQLLQETVFVSASMGITLYPDDAQAIDNLLKNADQAMYLAKSSGRNRFRYFTAALQEAAQTRTRLINDLRGALAGKQLAVYYQPIVEMASGKIVKAEALLRWQHPEQGMVSPLQFIPLAEESGLIHEIGDWVFHEATRELKRWRERFVPEFQVSVNVSPVQFRQSGAEDASSWLSHLRAMDLPGQGLVIEITEGLLMNVEINVTEKLLSFHAAGVQVALDDFGTGYSSLSYLKKFDIDYLKIDQAFVRDLAEDANDQALCEAIIVMAHKLGLKVIAEGVETEPQRDLLASYGCDYAQGWLYSKAVPPEQFEALVWGQVK